MNELMPTACVERIDELLGWRPPTESVVERLHTATALPEPSTYPPLDSATELAIEEELDPMPLIERFASTRSLCAHVLAAVSRRVPPSFAIQMPGARRHVGELLEEVQEKAGRLRLWAAPRRAAALLEKVDLELSPAVTALLVRHEHIQADRADSDDSILLAPLIQQQPLPARDRQPIGLPRPSSSNSQQRCSASRRCRRPRCRRLFNPASLSPSSTAAWRWLLPSRSTKSKAFWYGAGSLRRNSGTIDASSESASARRETSSRRWSGSAASRSLAAAPALAARWASTMAFLRIR